MAQRFVIKRAEESQFPEIIDFLMDHFFPRERINVASGYASERRKDDVESRQRYTRRLEDGVSLIAVDPESNKLAGVCMNVIARRSGEPHPSMEHASRSMSAVWTFCETLEAAFNVFDALNVDKGIDLRFLCVAEEFSGLGLGRRLINETIDIARALNLPFLQSLPTAAASAHLFEELSFETKVSFKMADFKLSDGLPAFPFATEGDMARYVVKVLQ